MYKICKLAVLLVVNMYPLQKPPTIIYGYAFVYMQWIYKCHHLDVVLYVSLRMTVEFRKKLHIGMIAASNLGVR